MTSKFRPGSAAKVENVKNKYHNKVGTVKAFKKGKCGVFFGDLRLDGSFEWQEVLIWFAETELKPYERPLTIPQGWEVED